MVVNCVFSATNLLIICWKAKQSEAFFASTGLFCSKDKGYAGNNYAGNHQGFVWMGDAKNKVPRCRAMRSSGNSVLLTDARLSYS